MTDDAVVVGAGPNGLAAAVTLAQRGLAVTVLEGSDDIGGGTRTRELTVPGLVHDVCSAVHPLAVLSPFLSSLPLDRHGLAWRWPEIDLAHPLDGGRAAFSVTSLADTAAGLGADGPAWRRTFGPLVDHLDAVASDILGPMLRVPTRPVGLARFGMLAGLPATVAARRFATDEGRALFGGAAAHAFRPLGGLATSAAGLLLLAAGHRSGWPVAAGGSEAITRALAGLLVELGGTIHTGVTVSSLSDLHPARLTLWDTAPSALVGIAGDRLPAATRRAFARYRHGPPVLKVDLAVAGGVPWTAEVARRAGTVHVGGTFEEIAAAEAMVHRGRTPERPFVLVAQQYLCDPERSSGDIHPVWAYAHVAKGFRAGGGDLVVDQMERFAPGLRERIVACHVTSPAELAAYNPNFVNGDISTGANDAVQLLFRPRISPHPYDTGIPGMFLCSAATPPGAGVHGMCGHHAALRALQTLDDG